MRIWVWLLILGSVFAWQHRYDIRDFVDPPKPIVNAEGLSVTLYATSWCGYCAKTREMFRTRGVPFKELDIEKSDAARTQFEKLGGHGVPVVVINGTVIHGYDRAEMERVLGAL
jgi:glutaredoxin